jgi:hypothetical protein
MLNGFSGRDPIARFQKRPFLVVDWMTTGVVLSEVAAVGGTPAIVRSQFEEWPAGFSLKTSAEEIGAWLKSVCLQAKLPTVAVAVSVSRRDLSLKLLELPAISDDELGPLVSLQVESRVQSTGQPVAWDFLAHPLKPGDTNRYVMLATIPVAVLHLIKQAAEIAGWSNLIVSSGDFLISNIAPGDNAAWQMHVQANRSKLELQLCYRDLPVASYATAMPTNGSTSSDRIPAATAIIQSMSDRLREGCPAAWRNDSKSSAVFIGGTFAPELLESFKHEAVAVRQTLADERTPRATAVASSLISDKAHRIDFLRPRSADGRTAGRRRRLIRIVATIACVVCFAVAGLWLWQRSLHNELAQLDAQRMQLQQFIDRGKDIVDKWSYVSRWQAETIHAADEIRSFAELLPSRERLIVTRLQLENVVDSEASTLRIDGMAQSAEDVLQMNASILEQSSHYDLRPQGIEPAPVGGSFPSQFRIEAVLRDDDHPERDNEESGTDEKDSK